MAFAGVIMPTNNITQKEEAHINVISTRKECHYLCYQCDNFIFTHATFETMMALNKKYNIAHRSYMNALDQYEAVFGFRWKYHR